ncbi:MAG: RNA-guided endonuclease TnpB family protein [Ktedonobacteraceae bacterium]
MKHYDVRCVHLGTSEQLDEHACECGRLYTQALVFFWRTVRHKGIFLKEKQLKRLFTSRALHAHTADACIEAFTASLKSWRERKKAGDPNAKPPHKRKWYFRIEYKRSAMSLSNERLRLSNGKGNAPLVLEWRWDLPRTVVIHWTGTEYEAIATYTQATAEAAPYGNKVAGIDLGEIHRAVSHDGTETYILNRSLLRSKVPYRNKLQAALNSHIDGRMKKGSKRRKRLIRSTKKQLKKIAQQIKDIEHQQTTRLITTLHQAGVRTVVIGDVRKIRYDLDVGSKNNQKLHQWSAGSVRFKLTYKAERRGMEVFLQEESYTSRTCPACGYVRSKVQGRVFHCPACHAVLHRDQVGAINIRRKYLGHGPVVGGDGSPPLACGIRRMLA